MRRRAAQSATESSLVAVAPSSALGQSLTSLFNKKSHSLRDIVPLLICTLCKKLLLSWAANAGTVTAQRFIRSITVAPH